MTERKYVVFVSSTKVDLHEHRQKVIEAIIGLKQIPYCMEYFPATPYPALNYINEQIEQSDIFLLILGRSIGSRAGDLTFIQHEYKHALEHDKDILLLTLPEDEFQVSELRAFTDEIMQKGSSQSRIVRHSRTSDQAAGEARAALEDLIKRKNAAGIGGWVEARRYDSLGGPFFERCLGFFASIDKFNSRTKRETAQKVSIGEYLWNSLIPKLDKEHPPEVIFFESGSSTAYAAYMLLEYARSNSGYWGKSQISKNLSIVTNNFFALLDFTLYQGMSKPVKEVVLYPQGPFSKDYGATYGPIRDVRPDDNTAFLKEGWSLSADAQEACSEVTERINQLLGDKGLIIMAVSGIDWSARHICGPHVGSLHNMLMKRSLFQARHAKVIILDDTKWVKSFNDDECFPVCGDGIEWAKMLDKSPVAFAVGISRGELEGMIFDKLHDLDFNQIASRRGDKVVDVFAYNGAFQEWLEQM